MLAYNKVSLTALVTLIYPHLVAGLTPYQHFFPRRGQGLAGLINGTCSTPYNASLRGVPGPVTDPSLEGWQQTEPGLAVVNCLLKEAPETVKVDFSSAQVILGLMLTILGVLGPSSQELSLLLVLGNRQFLALCLALGSPFTKPDHSLDFAREIKGLPRFNDDSSSSGVYSWQASAPFLYFQYLIVFAAIANIAELSYEFARSAPSAIIQQSPNYLPGLMTLIGFLMHLLVAFTFHFRVEIVNSSTSERHQRSTGKLTWFKMWTSQQLGAIDPDISRSVKLKPAEPLYTIVSWFTKIAIFTHVGYYIVAFSTVLFVSSLDAVVLLFRYFASVCVCRMVAANEIAVLGTIVRRKAKMKTQDMQVFHHTSRGKDTVYKCITDDDDASPESHGSC